MERCDGAGSVTHHLVARQVGYVVTLEPGRTPAAPAPALPACHIRAPRWTSRTSAASTYAPFAFIKRKQTGQDGVGGDEDAPDHVPDAVATTGPLKALLDEVPGAAEVGGGRREQVSSPPPWVTYQRRRARHRPRFKSLETMLQETAPGDRKDDFNQAAPDPCIAR